MQVISKIFRALETFKLVLILSFRRVKLFITGLSFPIEGICLLPSSIAEGRVLKIKLKPRREKNETERAVLILVCGGIRRHLHTKDAENYSIILNLSLDPFTYGGWVGQGTKNPWHEIHRVLGLRVVYAIKKLSAG